MVCSGRLQFMQLKVGMQTYLVCGISFAKSTRRVLLLSNLLRYTCSFSPLHGVSKLVPIQILIISPVYCGLIVYWFTISLHT